MHIYFAGLGGVAIGPLALMSLDLDYDVSGSDRERSRYTDILASRDIEVGFDQTGTHLRQVHDKNAVDLYVHTSAMPANHPEIQVARELGIDTTKRHELINRILGDKNLKLIAVSGTHGKTTTTAMLVWLFHELNVPIAHLVGTNLTFAPSGQYQKGAQYLIYEADEYDRNMLQFRPALSVIPSLDYDHPDTYPTADDYREAFRQFVAQSDHTILWQSTADLLGLKSSYSLTVVPGDRDFSRLSLPGQHNRANAWLAVSTVARVVGEKVAWDELCRVISRFPGSERRFEKLGANLYTDYAHHPEEIRATLGLAREVAGGQKVVAVYQPHQNLRQHALIDQYQDCFKAADKLYWLPTYLSREDKSQSVLQPKQLIDKLTVKPDTEIADLNEELADNIRNHLKAGDVVVIMGAGSIDEWLRDHFGA